MKRLRVQQTVCSESLESSDAYSVKSTTDVKPKLKIFGTVVDVSVKTKQNYSFVYVISKSRLFKVFTYERPWTDTPLTILLFKDSIVSDIF